MVDVAPPHVRYFFLFCRIKLNRKSYLLLKFEVGAHSIRTGITDHHLVARNFAVDLST